MYVFLYGIHVYMPSSMILNIKQLYSKIINTIQTEKTLH